MPPKNSPNPKLTQEQLEALDEDLLLKKKLALEIQSLQDQLTKPHPGFLEQVRNVLQKYLGQIVAISVLIGGVVTPVTSYVSQQRKDHLRQTNSKVLSVLDSVTVSSEALLMSICTEDPYVAAPLLLYHLNNDATSAYLMKKIYVKMYSVNKELTDYTWQDKILLFFVKDNISILKAELIKNACNQFSLSPPFDDKTRKIMVAYVNLIFELGLNNERDFKNALDILSSKCNQKDYRYICGYIKDVENDKMINK
jgi:hypothetical protein